MSTRPGAMSRPEGLTMGLVAAGALAFYLPRVCPAVVLTGDSPELVAAGAEWGVPHAPGFPLYTASLHALMLGGTPGAALRANLLSALLHALTVAVVARIAWRLAPSEAPVRARVVGAATAAMALALSLSFVKGSLYAEVFPLNDLFTSLLLLGAVAQAPTSVPGLLGVAALGGVALAGHPIAILGSPAIFVATGTAYVRSLRERPVRALWTALAFTLPLAGLYSLCLVAASRHPFVSWGHVDDLPSLLRLVTRADYGGVLHTSRTTVSFHPAARLATWLHLLWGGPGPVGLALAVAGGVVLVRRSRRQGLAMALAFLVPGPAFALMNSLFEARGGDLATLAERFATMQQIPLAVLAGVAVTAAACLWPRLYGASWAAPALLAASLAPAALACDLHEETAGDAFAEDLLGDLPGDAVVLLTGDLSTSAADYACVVREACKGLTVIAPGELFMDAYREGLRDRYPTLPPFDDVRSIRQTGTLVARVGRSRPVFAMGHVLERDPSLARDSEVFPSRLLLRLVPRDDPQAVSAARARWREEAQALADGRGCALCDGLPRAAKTQGFGHELAALYGASLANHAVTAARLGEADLASRLDARRVKLGSSPLPLPPAP